MPTATDLAAPLPSAFALLGPPPLNPGDDPAGYDTLLARLAAEVGPRGVIEEACLREAAEMMWEAARSRRLKAKLMTVSAGKAVLEVLRSIGVEFLEAHDLAPRWAARELAAVGEVDALLGAAGLDIHHVMAKALAMGIGEIERIDRMAARAETRRTAALREMMIYRDPVFTGRLQAAIAAAAEGADGAMARLPAPAGAASADADAAADVAA
jgi:hypothetical protein